MWYRMFHPIKNLYRRYRYGGGCCDVFSLDYYLAKKILPSLKLFRDKTKEDFGGYPCGFDTPEEWTKVLDEMIWSFQYLVDGEETGNPFDLEVMGVNAEREQKGFELFGKHFRNLWL
jgi:hypothetical protein